MAQNERTTLKKAIRQAQIFDADQRSPYSLEIFLIRLNGANQSENKELWQQLRMAMAENSQLRRKAPKAFFDRPFFAKKGWWWWDPAEWKVPEAAK